MLGVDEGDDDVLRDDTEGLDEKREVDDVEDFVPNKVVVPGFRIILFGLLVPSLLLLPWLNFRPNEIFSLKKRAPLEINIS